MTKYNGHRSWNAWNVSLWIRNDESLYRMVDEYVKRTRTLDRAAAAILTDLQEMGVTHTPDNAKFNYRCIREAIRDWC